VQYLNKINKKYLMGLYGDYGEGFHETGTRKIMDVAFWCFAIVYLIGDYLSEPNPFTVFTAFTLVKPIPIFLIAAQLWPVRNAHSSVFKIMLGLLIGSVGDILLLINGLVKPPGSDSPTLWFAAGAAAFLVGHILYVVAFLEVASDCATSTFNLAATMAHKALFMVVWTVLVALTFFMLGGIMINLKAGSIGVYVLPIYGTFLLMMVMAALFYFFTCRELDPLIAEGALFVLVGAISFFISDSLLAEMNFNPNVIEYKKIMSFFNMVTYYLGQFLIGKAGVKIAAYFTRSKVSTI
jgi:uncharacterized membrane protein YhhN